MAEAEGPNSIKEESSIWNYGRKIGEFSRVDDQL
jgi:hypothetical protein